MRVEPYDVFIGRPSKWGNPYTHLHMPNLTHVDTVEEAVEKYEKWIIQQIKNEPRWFDLDELRGRVLGCFCKPGPCHGDVLVRLCDGSS